MSILIRDMEMPKNCWLCPLSVLYEKPREMLRCKLTKEEVLRYKIDSKCPLIELPPHGRLIDADAIDWVEGRDEQDRPVYLLLKAQIDNIPTIIEAEGEDD